MCFEMAIFFNRKAMYKGLIYFSETWASGLGLTCILFWEVEPPHIQTLHVNFNKIETLWADTHQMTNTLP